MKNATPTTLLALLVALAAGIGIGLAIAGDGTPSAPPAPRASNESDFVARSEKSITQAQSGRAAPSTSDRNEFERSIRRTLNAQSGLVPTAETGEGRIEGLVEKATGQPLSGVQLVAERRTADGDSRPRRLGVPPPSPQTLESALASAAEQWQSRRSREYRTTSDPSGRFAFTNLPSGKYTVRAYRDGFEVRSEPRKQVFDLGASIRFVARPVYEVEFDLRLPDGSQPGEASLEILGADNVVSKSVWTPDQPTKQIVQPAVQVLARSFVGEQPLMFGSIGDRSRFRSEPIPVTPARSLDAPVRIELLTRSGILGQVTNLSNDQQVTIRLFADTPGQPVDWKRSIASSWCKDGVFVFSDLQPGDYVVGFGNTPGKPPASASVTVTEGFADCILRLPAEGSERTTLVRCLTPEGEPVPDVTFNLSVLKDSESIGSVWVGPKTGSDGTSRVQLSNRQDLRPEWFEPPHRFVFIGSCRGFAPVTAPWKPGQEEVVLQFEEGCDLTVQVTGIPEDLRKSLIVELKYLTPALADRARQSADPSKPGAAALLSNPRLGQDGSVRFHALAPGPLEVRLISRMAYFRSSLLSATRVDAIAGPQTVTVALPVLHEFVVHAPGLYAQTEVELTAVGQDGLPMPNWVSHQRVATGKDKRARFPMLPAGTYELRIPSAKLTERVTVPTGEFRVTASSPNAVKVVIGDPEGLLARQGFENGDVVVAIDGTELTTNNLVGALRSLSEGRHDVTVLREGRRVALNIEALPAQPTPANLGGQILPTSR